MWNLGKRTFVPRFVYSEEWLQTHLSKVEYWVTQKGGWEKPFSGHYLNHFKEGRYDCIVCGNKLFIDKQKFQPKEPKPYATFHSRERSRYFSEGTVLRHTKLVGVNDVAILVINCKYCGAFLGDCCSDKESKTGVRYNVNSAALDHYEHLMEEDPIYMAAYIWREYAKTGNNAMAYDYL